MNNESDIPESKPVYVVEIFLESGLVRFATRDVIVVETPAADPVPDETP